MSQLPSHSEFEGKGAYQEPAQQPQLPGDPFAVEATRSPKPKTHRADSGGESDNRRKLTGAEIYLLVVPVAGAVILGSLIVVGLVGNWGILTLLLIPGLIACAVMFGTLVRDRARLSAEGETLDNFYNALPRSLHSDSYVRRVEGGDHAAQATDSAARELEPGETNSRSTCHGGD